MLPKNQRIPRKLFPTLSRGRSVSSGIFLLRFAGSDTKDKKFCFSVSKKISKSAVIRNRFRRSGYRLIKKFIPDVKNGTLAIFYFKKPPRNDKELEESIRSTLEESRLIS